MNISTSPRQNCFLKVNKFVGLDKAVHLVSSMTVVDNSFIVYENMLIVV